MRRLIDAHAHVVEHLHGFARGGELRAVGHGRARWADGSEFLIFPETLGEKDVTFQRLHDFLTAKGVEKAVLLQGSFYGFQNEYTLEAARAYPEMFVPAFTFDPFAGNWEKIFDRFFVREGVHLVKFEVSSDGGIMSYHEPFRLDGMRLLPIAEAIAQGGGTLVLDIGTQPNASFQPDAVANLAVRFPKMHIIVCHLTAPRLGEEEGLRRALTAMKACNIWFDLSAIPWKTKPETYPYPTARRYVAMAKDIVGASKLLWGSDLPSPLTRDSYEHLYEYLDNGELFTLEELEGVYWRNAMAAYML